MTMLRRQMLLHAYLYYTLGDNVIADHEWDRRAQECYKLQQENGWNINFYDEIFRNFEGQSGYWFPTNKEGLDENVDRVARRLLENTKQVRRMDDCITLPNGAAYSAKWYAGVAHDPKEPDNVKIKLDKSS